MSEWDRRELCPDGTCVGVIGPDGTCKVCGKEAASGARKPASGVRKPSSGARKPVSGEEDAEDAEPTSDADSDSADSADSADSSDSSDTPGGQTPDGGRPAAGGAEGSETGDDWDRRELCPDGACVGVIGDDGKCTVCGRTAA